MPKYTVSFIVESGMDPSRILEVLHEAVADLAYNMGDASSDEDCYDSCCVATMEDE
jgi:hypothetical protein